MIRAGEASEAGQTGLQAAAGLAPYAVLILAVWAAWQIVCAPVLERAPPEIAIRISPTSPTVLRRAAEAELAARRFDNAENLARRALQAAPFDVRALSVIGMAIAERDRDTADEILTLAGNRSLRDDPTHAWLMQERLRRGDYASSFAHADTLARRRPDLQPGIFNLFRTAAREDPRSLRPLISLLSVSPPWRTTFFDSLYVDPQGGPVLAALAIGLQNTSGPLDDAELGRLYGYWLETHRVEAVRLVRDRIGRPSPNVLLTDGDFLESSPPGPFGWTLNQSPDFTAAVMNDDRRGGDSALRVDLQGIGGGRVAQQFMLLRPGAYRFSFEARSESEAADTGLIWRIECIGGGRVMERRLDALAGNGPWISFENSFVAPSGCEGQRLVLEAPPSERRGPQRVVWIDRIRIERQTRQ
ncbi:MAG: hypothetical protein V4707_11115 [Pseudomonadota bacterium]